MTLTATATTTIATIAPEQQQLAAPTTLTRAVATTEGKTDSAGGARDATAVCAPASYLIFQLLRSHVLSLPLLLQLRTQRRH